MFSEDYPLVKKQEMREVRGNKKWRLYTQNIR